MNKGRKSGDSVVVTRSLFQTGDGSSILTSPHQLEVQEVEVKFACGLNEEWHSRLPKIDWSNVVRNKNYACYIAVWNGRAYAVGIWSSPVSASLNQDEILELRRLAISNDAPKNTASRMLRIMRNAVFKRFPQVNKLISYQDTEVHNGTIYKADNWKKEAQTKFSSWTTKKRQRNDEQSKADKIRWEYKKI